MLGIDVIIERSGPGRYHARVEIPIETLSGIEDECLGAAAEGETPGAAVEDATAKAIALLRGNPELAAALLPIAGPELTLILMASRYLDAPEILQSVTKEARHAVKKTARKLKKAAKKAKKVGRGVARAAKGIGHAITSLW